ATKSGAGCGNHWPLCNGQVVPLSPRLDTIIEFAHRCMTGGAGFVLIALVIWIFRSTAKGKAARTMAVASCVLILIESLLGALLVKLGYVTGNQSTGRVVMLSIHFTNTLLMMGAMIMTAVMLGSEQETSELRLRGPKAPWVTLGLIATLVVGVSGSLAALGDTLFPASSLRAAFEQDISSSSPLLLRLRGVHPLSALIVTAFVIWLAAQARRMQENVWANAALRLLVLQIILGVLDVVLLAPVWMQVVHLLGADLFWVAMVTLSAKVLWPVRTANPSAA
ncbi:MAG TPA: COX15/CtaA family protein, partial [Edaphobacter sp.]